MLELRGLARTLPKLTVGPLDLAVAAGEYFVLLGPTGAGKSVTLGLLAGWAAPSAGTILLDGRDVTALPPERRGLGVVAQDGLLFPHRDVRWNISFPLAGLAPEPLGRRVNELAERLGIAPLLDRRIAHLSGGEQQRVALARALAPAPALLLLDEPLGALDPETRRGLRRELRRLPRERGTAVLHVTHDFEEAAALADRVGIMIGGELRQVGTVADVFHRPADRAVAAFLGLRNFLRGTVIAEGSGRVLVADGLRLQLPADEAEGEAVFTVSPDSLVVSREPLHSSARNVLSGTVREVEPGLAVCRVTVAVGVPLEVTVTPASRADLGLAPGVKIHLLLKSTSLHRL